MFTDPPLLVERIARSFDLTRIVDGRSRLKLDAPSVRSLAELLDHPGLVRELRSVGAPESALNSSATDPLQSVRERLPFLRLIRNTSTSWRLRRILNDLYDYVEPEIRESDVEELDSRIARNAVDPTWASHVLAERCRIDGIVCDLADRPQSFNPAETEDRFSTRAFYFWDASPLLTYDHPVASSAKKVTKPAYSKKLAAVIGQKPGTMSELNRGIQSFLEATVTGQVKFLSTRLSTKVRIERPDEDQIDHLLAQESGGVPLTDDETDRLMSAVAWSVFSWANDHRRVLQLNGVGRSPHQPYSCPAALGKLAATFGGVRFVLADYARDFARHAHFLAASKPNIALGGFSDGTFVTPLIGVEFAERLQSVPVGKCVAFMSHATSVEWLYGNLIVLRQGLARGLAGAVEDDHIHENQVRDLLSATLGVAAVHSLDLK
jgi:hypothetical protein